MESGFVDPRIDPKPSPTRKPPRTTADPAALAELHKLCSEGRLYDVERWVRSDRPLQVAEGVRIKGRRLTSALEIALEAGEQGLALLLLCNGYDPNLESSGPLNIALRRRRWDLLDLLLEWGANPRSVCLTDLFETYRSELWYRFQSLGIDLTERHQMAEALAYHTSNRPLFGFVRRHRDGNPKMQRELDIALVHHAGEGNEKGVALCLWAGANPHTPAPSFRYSRDLRDEENVPEEDRFRGFTALQEACRGGHLEILKRLGPDPSRDDFEGLYEMAESTAVINFLAPLAPPKDAWKQIHWKLLWLAPPFERPGARYALERLFEVGMRWVTSSPDEISYFRRTLLKMSRHTFEETMKVLATADYCSPEILKLIASKPKVRERMREVGFIPLPPDHPKRWNQVRPTRSREVLAKFGVELPKPKPSIPRIFEIGPWHGKGKELRMTREELFERVWTEPVWNLAKEWGLSDRGLAKACGRLEVPLPSRGYWAKVQAGQRPRRPKLPELSNQPEEIVIRVPHETMTPES